MLIKNNNRYNINKDIDNPNLIFWNKYKYWKKIGLHTHTYIYCRVTICSSSPKDLRYEPNTMNLQRVCERVGLLENGLMDNKDSRDEQTKKNTDKA